MPSDGNDGTSPANRSFWGWGFEGAGPNEAQAANILRGLTERFDCPLDLRDPPRLEDIDLPEPRLSPPPTLAHACSQAPRDRALHCYGRSYSDVVRGARGDFRPAPDVIAYPRDEAEVAAFMDWCGSERIALIPFGGGSSVVGGVEARVGESYPGSLCLDLSHLNEMLELDRTSRCARFQGGIYGPALEDALRPHQLTLRHFPQSFEFSTLGGWIATRSGGHYATLQTHIDDFVESLRVVTPVGVSESRRLPGSGAGPSPDRHWIGSEGALGVITEAWMRVQERPRFRASTSVRFAGKEGFARGAEAVRALSQSGLHPANCRLLDAGEAAQSGAGDGGSAILVLGFESADHPLDAWMTRALELCQDTGGTAPEPVTTRRDAEASREGAGGAWRKAFLQAPYVRDILVRAACISETFESAVTWERFEAFHATVSDAVHEALERVCGGGSLSCRFTHVYPDGPAPYYTIIAPGRRGSELEQWREIKSAASEALLHAGGSITHHHAVGRDHRPWYDRQRPELFARSLQASKRSLDPAGILNPGVLVDSDSD